MALTVTIQQVKGKINKTPQYLQVVDVPVIERPFQDSMMKKPIVNLCLTCLLLALSIHTAVAADKTINVPANAIIADVNGNKLTVADFQAYIKMRLNNEKQPNRLDQAQREKIFGEYINRELLYQEAVKNGLDKNPLINAEIENQRRNIVVSYTLQQLMRTPPKESDMQAVYEKELAVPGKEYKSRHILVKTEEQAKQIIAELESGKNFIQLAKQHSIDASAKKGGELGWFSAHQMVEPFSEATQKLSNGSYTHTPVNTRFGWHIIRLDGTREIPPPSFEDVKEHIVSLINNRRISAYIGSLRQNASVTVATSSKLNGKDTAISTFKE
jgi:peptidyl-prolyl cis-trans isomerase C